MNETTLLCQKCNSPMQVGFLSDQLDGVTCHEALWVEGIAEESFWSGVKHLDRMRYSTETFRCINCGYLEMYARNPKY
jgi:predicted nucleic-acid-binding Zn-ribbon protein